MPRIAYLTFYDGLVFNGFTGTGYTVERALKQAFKEVIGRDVRLLKASRTDPGVSALCNVIAVDLEESVRPEAVNSGLPRALRLWAWAEVDSSFNPRRAVCRTYVYLKPYEGEDLNLVREAAKHFVGTRNLANFQIVERGASTITTIYDLSVHLVGDAIMYKVVGKGFRNKMIRKIVWTLTEVGLGRMSLDYVVKLVNVEVRRTVPSADPEGLVLAHVSYGGKITFRVCRNVVAEIAKYLTSCARRFTSLRLAAKHTLTRALDVLSVRDQILM